MEVRFDLDTEARETADELGLEMVRAGTVGTAPRFVSGLVDLMEERAQVALGATPEQPTEGSWGPSHSVCPVGCCRNLRADLPAACGEDWVRPAPAGTASVRMADTETLIGAKPGRRDEVAGPVRTRSANDSDKTTASQRWRAVSAQVTGQMWGGDEGSVRPHNPSVVGSSPTCPGQLRGRRPVPCGARPFADVAAHPTITGLDGRFRSVVGPMHFEAQAARYARARLP